MQHNMAVLSCRSFFHELNLKQEVRKKFFNAIVQCETIRIEFLVKHLSHYFEADF
jgi:hypothetical protein